MSLLQDIFEWAATIALLWGIPGFALYRWSFKAGWKAREVEADHKIAEMAKEWLDTQEET